MNHCRPTRTVGETPPEGQGLLLVRSAEFNNIGKAISGISTAGHLEHSVATVEISPLDDQGWSAVLCFRDGSRVSEKGGGKDFLEDRFDPILATSLDKIRNRVIGRSNAIAIHGTHPEVNAMRLIVATTRD